MDSLHHINNENKLEELQKRLPKSIPFTRETMWMGKDDPQSKYFKRDFHRFRVPHWGQLKLMIAEMQYLLLYSHLTKPHDPVVVYAGAAPGHHTSLLIKMFPKITWHLYDPAPSIIEESDKVHVYQVPFSDEIASSYADTDGVMFISDIRSINPKDITIPRDVVEVGIWKDMEDQQRWTQLMKPTSAHLKMRLPYVMKGAPSSVTYLDGHVMYQAFSASSSTEARLVAIPDAEGNFKTKRYNLAEYDNKHFYRNNVLRLKGVYRDHILGNTHIDDNGNMDAKLDSRILLWVCDYYMLMRGSTSKGKTRLAEAIGLSRWIRKGISDIHYRLYNRRVTIRSKRQR